MCALLGVYLYRNAKCLNTPFLLAKFILSRGTISSIIISVNKLSLGDIIAT